MTRPIDADALLEKLNDINVTSLSALIEEQRTVAFYVYCKVVNALEKMPTIDAVPAWVSVKDRLPTETINALTRDFDEVICATVFGDVRCYKYGHQHFWHGPGIMDEYVTHWMPIPEPPKEVTT